MTAEGAERDVEAAYHEGEIHVFPGHIESAERFNFVVGHHEMRHYGIRGILGQQYKQVLTGIAMRNPTLRAAARAKQDAGLAKDLATGVDEALADMPVEEIAALSGIDRLVSRIRQWLRETAAKLREYKLFALADAIAAAATPFTAPMAPGLFAASAAYFAAGATLSGLGAAIAPSAPAPAAASGASGDAGTSRRQVSDRRDTSSDSAAPIIVNYYAPVIGGRESTDAEVGVRLGRFDDAARARRTRRAA